jgi:hypothetical protein
LNDYRKYYWQDILFINGKTGIPTWMIQVHHLDKNRENNNPDNLYLCREDYHYETFHPNQWNWVKKHPYPPIMKGENNPWFGKKRPEHSKWMKGDNNPNKRPEVKEKISKTRNQRIDSGEITFDYMKGDNSPMKRPEVLKKFKCENNPNFNHDYVMLISYGKNILKLSTRKACAKYFNFSHGDVKRNLACRGLTWEDI